jgi:branched-chain amino acid transport system ATP-binding protein
VTARGEVLLTAEGIGISFGGLRALDGVGFAARAGEILAIIGPNGAGKTTLFNIVSGLYRAGAGRITLTGQDVTEAPPHRLAALGLSRTFQNLQVFFRMTAAENVMAGRHLQERSGLFSDLFRLPARAAPTPRRGRRRWRCWPRSAWRSMPTRRRAACPMAR